jgi:hypothetical protein|eukprot:COSAG06_NODE_441_length_15740_cov_6.214144_24_plen_105_part_00
MLSRARTLDVAKQSRPKRPSEAKVSSEAPKKQRRNSCKLTEGPHKVVKGIVNHKGIDPEHAEEYKVRFSKPYQDKSLDEWWAASQLDLEQIKVYVARKARKTGK